MKKHQALFSPSKQIWKDFSSGKGGNVIAFLWSMSNLTIQNQFDTLANKYNIEIIEQPINLKMLKKEMQENLCIINSLLKNTFKIFYLKDNVRDYLIDRGFQIQH